MPLERLAVDLVGTLARNRDGYKYLLTSICVASRYHFAGNETTTLDPSTSLVSTKE